MAEETKVSDWRIFATPFPIGPHRTRGARSFPIRARGGLHGAYVRRCGLDYRGRVLKRDARGLQA